MRRGNALAGTAKLRRKKNPPGQLFSNRFQFILLKKILAVDRSVKYDRV